MTVAGRAGLQDFEVGREGEVGVGEAGVDFYFVGEHFELLFAVAGSGVDEGPFDAVSDVFKFVEKRGVFVVVAAELVFADEPLLHGKLRRTVEVDGGDEVVESISINFAKVSFAYDEQKSDGSMNGFVTKWYDTKTNTKG